MTNTQQASFDNSVSLALETYAKLSGETVEQVVNKIQSGNKTVANTVKMLTFIGSGA